MSRSDWSVGEQAVITDVLAAHVDNVPDRVFVEFSGTELTYAEVDERSDRIAQGLLDRGVAPGDRVAILMTNTPEFVLSFFGIVKLGAVAVPVNHEYHGDFLHQQLADCAAVAVITDTDGRQRLLDIVDALPDLRFVVADADPDRRDRHGTHTFAGLEAAPRAVNHFPAEPETPACLIYTSGTTGQSKGCVVSHNFLLDMGRRTLRAFPRTVDERVWTPLPMFHISGLGVGLMATLLVGGSISYARRFSLSSFWPEIKRTNARIAHLVGTLMWLVARADDTPESIRCRGQLRAVGGEPANAELQRIWFERFGTRRLGTGAYGCSELGTITERPDGVNPPPNSCGIPSRDFDVRIVDANHAPVPAGQVGEIVCRPLRPNIMFNGYWGRPAETLLVLRHLWYHTGDLGWQDEHGWLHFADRKDDYFRRRGENISSFEIEAQCLKHPEVEAVAATAVPSDLGEDDVKVTAVLIERSRLTEEDFHGWLAESLPRFAVPRYVEFVPDLPRSAAGKILKRRIREQKLGERVRDFGTGRGGEARSPERATT